jgi:hypothetical protein
MIRFTRRNFVNSVGAAVAVPGASMLINPAVAVSVDERQLMASVAGHPSAADITACGPSFIRNRYGPRGNARDMKVAQHPGIRRAKKHKSVLVAHHSEPAGA